MMLHGGNKTGGFCYQSDAVLITDFGKLAEIPCILTPPKYLRSGKIRNYKVVTVLYQTV